MPRKAVVQIQCSRCPRVEVVEMSPEEASEKKNPDFEAVLRVGENEKKLVFEDLCSTCKEIVGKGVESLQAVTKTSAKRTKKKAEDATAEIAQGKLQELAAPRAAVVHNGTPPPMRAPRG